MRTEQVFEMSRSDTNKAEQHAKLFQALRSTANTGSVSKGLLKVISEFRAAVAKGLYHKNPQQAAIAQGRYREKSCMYKYNSTNPNTRGVANTNQ